VASIRTPDQRLRVFVSSTLVELAPERAAAREAIEDLRLTPVLFELGARPHPPRELYRSYLEQSDVFVGIYGERYGWVAPEMEISGLEDEFVLSRSKPRLIYVKTPAAEREPRLHALIEQIQSDADVSYRPFASAAELKTLIADDLAVLVSERFRPEPRETRLRASVPAPVDPFVGRTAMLEDLARLLSGAGNRLVTITGPGGVGKTRLALEAARAQAGFADGAHFVALAPVGDPALVVEAVRDSLGLPAPSGMSQLDALIDGLRESHLLLVLDNFERLLAAAPDVAALLEACSELTALVTSRAVLRLRGERELQVEPLTVPNGDAPERSESFALFIERARAASPQFELSDHGRDAVVEICRRLEGLPLALELAAARVRHLPPAAMLERLESRLELPSGGAGYPERQRTMRAALDWSFELLDADEQAVFARTAVFRGGWTIAAFEAICAAPAGGDALDALASLVDKSLVRPVLSGDEPRFFTLETIREYAAERLDEAAEGDELRERHARFYLALVDEAGPALRRAGHAPWLARLDRDEDNVRAALSWSLEGGEFERVAQVAWALMPYWLPRERFAEGRRITGAVLARAGDVSPTARARVFTADGFLAFWCSDFEGAVAPLTEALTAFRELGDSAGAALAQVPLALLAGMRGAAEPARELVEESRGVLREAGDEWGRAFAGIGLGFMLNATRADAPIEFFEELVEQSARLGPEAETIATGVLGHRRLIRGERAEAKLTVGRVLRRALEFKAPVGVRWYLEMLADLATDEGEDALAARLSAAAESVVDLSDASDSPLLGNRAQRVAGLRERLGDEAFERESQAGRALDMDAAGAQALEWAEGQRAAGGAR
jgi:predicted ATPase